GARCRGADLGAGLGQTTTRDVEGTPLAAGWSLASRDLAGAAAELKHGRAARDASGGDEQPRPAIGAGLPHGRAPAEDALGVPRRDSVEVVDLPTETILGRRRPGHAVRRRRRA